MDNSYGFLPNFSKFSPEPMAKVEETIEEMEEGDRSSVMGSTGEGFSLTMDGMSNSLAMSFQWLDKVNYF